MLCILRGSLLLVYFAILNGISSAARFGSLQEAIKRINSTANVTEPTNSTANVTKQFNSTANVTEPTNSTANVTEPTNSTANVTEPTNSTANVTEPTNSTANVTEPTNSTAEPAGVTFHLKLYWQSGYYWQEETSEKKWCIECMHGCYEGNLLRIRKCDDGEPDQRFQLVGGSGGDQIKVVNEDLCMTRMNSRDTELQTCNLTDYHQLWVGFKSGGERFELSPNNSSGCVTNNRHHPKDKELIWVDTCEKAREDTTSFWNTYYEETLR